MTVSRSVGAVARAIRVHPVRDYLMGLRWDGVPRLERWAIVYLGAEDTALNRAIGSRWMISGVARIIRALRRHGAAPMHLCRQRQSGNLSARRNR